MIKVEGLNQVVQRIEALNERFGIKGIKLPNKADGTFAKILDKEINQSNIKTDSTNTPQSADEIAKANSAAGIAATRAANAYLKAAGASVASSNANIAAGETASVTGGNSGISIGGDTGAMIQAAAAKYNVDPRLLGAVAETESGGNQDAVSSAGAIGVMQLMPDTAASLGVNPYDERQNIEGGAKYIRQMLDTFNGDVQKAVAAYNAGPQVVKDYGGIPPYRETQNYVNKVMDIYW